MGQNLTCERVIEFVRFGPRPDVCEGAFEAMGTGTVDLNWAKEHHSLWLEEEQAYTGLGQPQARSTAKPVPD